MPPKREASEKVFSAKKVNINDPLNVDSWNCVVVMAVERTSMDSFLIRNFVEEALNGRRQEVKVIDFDTLLLNILTDFANGEVPFNYAYLLNFSGVFQKAAKYAKNSEDIPIPLLVKVIKALLFYLKEESLMKLEKKMSSLDPIKAMAERPSNPMAKGVSSQKKEEKSKKHEAAQDGGLIVKPPSENKTETKLLKRGEEAKPDQWIEDAPLNGYFNLYVLLAGFYYPDLPLELIKAGIPLYGFLCLDTSRSGVKRNSSLSCGRYQRRNSEERSRHIQNFWDTFLKSLWDPNLSSYFKDVIFQVYVPQRLLCEKKKLQEFIYKEISFLLYDISDIKRCHQNYLNSVKLWTIEEPSEAGKKKKHLLERSEMSDEGANAPVPTVLQFIIDLICEEDGTSVQESLSCESVTARTSESVSWSWSANGSPSPVVKIGSPTTNAPAWSQIMTERNDCNDFEIYTKIKELDAKYDFEERCCFYEPSEIVSTAVSKMTKSRHRAQNMDEALRYEDGIFKSYWKKHKKSENASSVVLDYCLYTLLMTKVACSQELASSRLTEFEKPACFPKKGSNFETIENVDFEMKKPHFTVTDGCRSILRCVPYNLKNKHRDFFCPHQYKVVTPKKIKASSDSIFCVSPSFTKETLFVSDLVAPHQLLQNMESHLGDHLLANVDGFYFIEELSKLKLLSREFHFWDNYNCADCAYSVLADSIFISLHNRTDPDGTVHETFNVELKTKVGLRDFFEYILEDEWKWFEEQEKTRHSEVETVTKKASEGTIRKEIEDSDFWTENSIKYQEHLRRRSESTKTLKDDKSKGATKTTKSDIMGVKKSENKMMKREGRTSADPGFSTSESTVPETTEHQFHGYDISGTAIQYSGLKTSYCAGDCSMNVDLTEKLYGNQDLRISARLGGHVLYLHSFVCPEPHLLDPFTCHLIYKSGIIVAFGRRFAETFQEREEATESGMYLSESGEFSSGTLGSRTKMIRNELEESFFYDMKLSLPNGLTVATVRGAVEPCYIKQKYLKPEGYSKEETSRLFLPNGDVVKMMCNGTVKIIKPDASVVSASLENLIKETDVTESLSEDEGEGQISEGDKLCFSKYEITTSAEGHRTVDGGRVTSTKKVHIFQNADIRSNATYYRRSDGTNYVVKNDGSLCVQFEDGTKIFSSIFAKEEEIGGREDSKELSGKTDSGSDFMFVYAETIVEHPDYATVEYNQRTRKWKIRLPFYSTITVEPEGNYVANVDENTEFRINPEIIRMERLSANGPAKCSVTADLTVFEKAQRGAVYCKMEDFRGKKFVVEANSNCYVDESFSETDTEREEEEEEKRSKEYPGEVELEGDSRLESEPESRLFEEDMKGGGKLYQKNKYFVVRRDISGFELFHQDEVKKLLCEVQTGSVTYTQEIPGQDNLRCFIVLTPVSSKKKRKWEVESSIPDPKFVPQAVAENTSTLYGNPPSWMHPFPKRKKKFKIPERLTCRAFLEIKRTNWEPNDVCPESSFCEMEKIPEVRHSRIEPGIHNVQRYMSKLANDDQDLLQEIYALVIWGAINEKKLKSGNSEALEHYLTMSNYYMEMQEYHKRCIRERSVPDFFCHPRGMSWLILNEIMFNRRPPPERKTTQERPGRPLVGHSSAASSEIEYNLSWRSVTSYSDLSYRSGLSTKSMPVTLMGATQSKVKPLRYTVSAPIYKFKKRKVEVDESYSEATPRTTEEEAENCQFNEENFRELGKATAEGYETANMTMEDLMCLGLV